MNTLFFILVCVVAARVAFDALHVVVCIFLSIKGFREALRRAESTPVLLEAEGCQPDPVRLAWIDALIEDVRSHLARSDNHAREVSSLVELLEFREQFAAGAFAYQLEDEAGA